MNHFYNIKFFVNFAYFVFFMFKNLASPDVLLFDSQSIIIWIVGNARIVDFQVYPA